MISSDVETISNDVETISNDIDALENIVEDELSNLSLAPIGTITAWTPFPDKNNEHPVDLPEGMLFYLIKKWTRPKIGNVHIYRNS